MKDTHIVLTTINTPDLLFSLYENINRFGHLETTVCWVVGDYKTPLECLQVCEKVSRLGLDVRYYDIPKQDDWGKSHPEFYREIPYNNESRRNIGYLLALECGCNRMLAIDDDNFPTNDDLIGRHEIASSVYEGRLLSDPSGFHNVCDYLDFSPSRKVYPRGFPFHLRCSENSLANYAHTKSAVTVGVNQGLWLKDPDVDATTWLNGGIQAVGFRGTGEILLDENTWMPLNTQNTCVARELIPAFFCIPMGYPVPGGRIERYGDIWGGYFLQALIKNSPYRVSFGGPLVEHRRNPHVYLDDLRYEFWGMMLTDWLLKHLKNSFTPGSEVITDRVVELANFLKENIESLPDWCPPQVYDFFDTTSRRMILWANVCKKIM